jgi:hypothetical protein
MIRPVNFGFNAETAVNNAFQVAGQDDAAQDKAAKEFDAFVQVLKDNGVDVTVVNDTPEPYTPDSIFPNNWVSFHRDGTIILYPMFATNRRQERKPGVLQQLGEKFSINKKIDLTSYEPQNKYLEGTGSMVLDRDKKIAYACISPRTDKTILEDFAKQMGYRPVPFTSVDQNGKAIYHTNVMMCVADRYVVICLDSIADKKERAMVEKVISESGKQIITITLDQMNHFAGNMLQIENNKGEKLLVMSSQAYKALHMGQVEQLESFNKIIHSSLDTIESNGGGSARCMMAEVFLPLLLVQ